LRKSSGTELPRVLVSSSTLGRFNRSEATIKKAPRPFLDSMRIQQATLRGFVLAIAVICGPIRGHGGQVALAISSTPPPPDNATAPALGRSKVLSNASTLAAGPLSGNSAPQSQHVVKLTWKASTSAGVRYNVYRSSKRGECLKTNSNNCQKISPSPVPSTSYTDSTVQAGHHYFYVVKAVSSGGPESGPSNEAPAVISPHKP
jgi:hypothetical protein